jgi:hypothetical protein
MDWYTGIRLGMPATIHCGSDSYAAEVVRIVPFATEAAAKRNGRLTKEVVVRYATGGGLNGQEVKFRLKDTKCGTEFYVPGARIYGLTLGEARNYLDPHF